MWTKVEEHSDAISDSMDDMSIYVVCMTKWREAMNIFWLDWLNWELYDGEMQ